MKNVRFPILAGAILASCASHGFAAGATPEEARRLSATFETYLGPAISGANAVFSITPAGDSYTLNFDFGRLLPLLEPFGAKIPATPPAWPLTLAPQPDGKWRVGQSGDFAFAIDTKGNVIGVKLDGVRSDYVFDPQLPGFVSGVSDARSMSSESSEPSKTGAAARSTRVSNLMHSSMTGVAKAPGVSTSTLTQTVHDTNQHISIALPDKGDGVTAAPVVIDISMGETTIDARLDGLRNRAILDLWAWLVAHPSKEAIRTAQEDFRTQLRAALPVFDRIDGAMAVKTMAVATQLGTFRASGLTFDGGLNGLGNDGAFNESLSLTGLELPASLLPVWSRPLAPTTVAASFKLTGFNPAGAAEKVIANFDLSATPPLKPEVGAALLEDLLPTGAFNIAFNGVRLASNVYELAVDGALKVSPGQKPVGEAQVRVKGFEAAMQALNEGAKTDPNAQQAAAALGVARMMGEARPDGEIVWRIVMADGGFTVNGAPLGGPPAKK